MTNHILMMIAFMACAFAMPLSAYAFDAYFTRITWPKPASFAAAAIILAIGVLV